MQTVKETMILSRMQITHTRVDFCTERKLEMYGY